MSWGHSIRTATANEMYNAWRDDHRRRCSYCDALGEYLTRYDYVTGKAGRVSDARHLVCRDHAAQFAAKHKLQMPTSEVTP